MSEEDVRAAVEGFLAAAGQQDSQRVTLLLHPYLHWTTTEGQTLRGRRRVMERLAAGPPPAPPSSFELRDGQIYRWTEGRS